MVYQTNLCFNPESPTVMHIDLNSCFATVEQQANPHLRGKPVAVVAYTSPGGCILAPSVEAKRLGVGVGMRVRDGKQICPGLIILPTDPWKYRSVHLSLRRILSDYTNNLTPKSIDEFVLNLKGYPSMSKGMMGIGKEIKERIRQEVGEWITVSVGISSNYFLAKLASSLHKPDGLDEISKNNYNNIYRRLNLSDLSGIKFRNTTRLNSVGIFSVLDFYNAPLWKLKAAFKSITGYYWYLRLRGWEIDDFESVRKSYGNSYALPKALITPEELSPILTKLVEKMGFRLRQAGYRAKGVHLGVSYRDWSFWHKGVSFPRALYDSREIYKKAFRLMYMSPYKKPVRELAVSTFGLLKSKNSQLELFYNVEKNENLVEACDEINERWGNYTLTPAKMFLSDKSYVPDRIAFGGVKELEEFTITK